MSWLARSIANTVDEVEQEKKNAPNAERSQPSTPTARGVKEDLSELSQNISRQIWGFTSFLAPPSEPQIPNLEPADEDLIAGIRSDLAEISGRFRSGISKLSGNKAVSGITKIASNFLQIGSEEEEPLPREYDLNGVVGLTEEVVAFARTIAKHPETWLDFPLPDDPDSDDFDLSDVQQEHALAIERLAPRLAALRLELCPGYMSDAWFWMIYFVLLHPRLYKNDADILSTPQILEARAMLSQVFNKRNKGKEEPDLSASGNAQSEEVEHHVSVPSTVQQESHPMKGSIVAAVPSTVVPDVKLDKEPEQSTEVQIIKNSKLKEAPVNPAEKQLSSGSANKFSDEADVDDADDWLNEDTSEMVGGSGTSIPVAHEDDVSFSDLEDDGDVPVCYKKDTATSSSDSSTKESRDWVQLSRTSTNSDKDINSKDTLHAGPEHVSARNSENKDSSDWLNVDNIDVI